MPYCRSRLRTLRRPTVEVMVGSVGVGGDNPIRLQSMTTSDTQDIDATVRQSVALAEVGCEIVRITAPNVQAARCLREIRARLSAAGFPGVPLVADIHFLPQAAMEAVEHVEKVRINPGNYADKKRFAVREYSDADYERELQRLHDAFSPLVRRARELGRSLRIGTNHGSLSDRILNRYGDTPLGMVESALEFLRIAEANGFRQLILSMKASNPKVMIQAYRLLVERMDAEGMAYPLHLGVTEAGDGEDGRIKSAIGIGSLLLDGLGDTIRVSLTEDSVYEIPVARALADRAMALWREGAVEAGEAEADPRPADPYRYDRRATQPVTLAPGLAVGGDAPPRVLVRTGGDWPSTLAGLGEDTPAEGLVVAAATVADLDALAGRLARSRPPAAFIAVEADAALPLDTLERFATTCPVPLALILPVTPANAAEFASLAARTRAGGPALVASVRPQDVAALAAVLQPLGEARVLVTLRSTPSEPRPPGGHAVGAYRALARALADAGCRAPLWIRNSGATAVLPGPAFLDKLLEASVLTGSLLADGFGDAVSIETEADPARSVRLAYNVLQGAGARISKTEFVACPSCGRTLFDLQTTTQRIREKTGHLKGVKIAIMGCIVNGPGEMADADFGYVGGAPGRINLYIGKTCVQYNVPQTEADERLIALIRENGKWTDPAPAPAGL